MEDHLKYPVGLYQPPEFIPLETVEEWIDEIDAFPTRLKKLVQNTMISQLSNRYRPDGWTIKQVIHHCTDSHMHSYIRFKWALTEDTPTIKAYHEDRWAELPDATTDDVGMSIKLLEALHMRWVALLRSLSPDELLRVFVHPETKKHNTLQDTIGNYAWHCRHHFAHIENALASEQRG